MIMNRKNVIRKRPFSGQLIQTDSGVVVKDYYIANGQLQMSGKYADFDRKVNFGKVKKKKQKP